MAHDAGRLDALQRHLHGGSGTPSPLGELGQGWVTDAVPGRPPVQQHPQDVQARALQCATMHAGAMCQALKAARSVHNPAAIGVTEALALPGGYTDGAGARRARG